MNGYRNIVELAKENNFKKIMVQRDSWANGGYGIVNELVLRSDDDKYGLHCLMWIHYANGNEDYNAIMPSGTGSWKLLKVLEDQNMKVSIKPKK